MRALLQRVTQASVAADKVTLGSIGPGLLALVGFSHSDAREDLVWMARKIVELRIFDDADGRLNLSLRDTGGELLVVSQFTLYGDCRKGRRPSYSEAAPPERAQSLYQEFLEIIRSLVPGVQSGRFRALMDVSLTNSGPVTLLVDSRTGT